MSFTTYSLAIAIIFNSALGRAEVATQLPKKLTSQAATAQKTEPQPETKSAKTNDPQGDSAEISEEQGQAKKTQGRLSLQSRNTVKINYGSTEWNRNAAVIDSGTLILREGDSGKIIQLVVYETEPDSSIFSGLYSISLKNIDSIKPEIFAPPQNLMEGIAGFKKVTKMIANGELRRKPFVLRRTAAGGQTIEIFDTRQQAQSAMSIYVAQIEENRKGKLLSDKQMDMIKLAAELKAKQAAEAALAERLRVEQLEAQRLADLKRKEAELNKAERARRAAQAKALSAEGMELYKNNKSKEATEKFQKALELDADNKSYYFQYGAALYKIESFDKALAYLKLAEGPDVNQSEKQFLIGMSHFRIKEFKPAHEALDKVIAGNQKELKAAAQFYNGVSYFEEQNWEAAKASFQMVLDTSTDPQLDNRAEAYIEQVLRIQQFELERSRKWQITLTLGEQYDSNITLVADSSLAQGAQTASPGYRTLGMGSVRYRPVYNETNEFAAQLDLMSMFTVDSKFAVDQTLRNTDPNVATFTAPWTYKGQLFGKGYKLDLTPGYESIYMSVEDNTTKEIISSMIFNVGNMFVINQNLFSNFNLESRIDKSKLTSATGDNDSSATKFKLANSNMYFLSEDKTQIMTSDFGYSSNQAAGKNFSFSRIDLGIGYMRPFYLETTNMLKFAYANLNYPQRSDNRTDASYTFTAGLTKKLSDTYTSGLMATYMMNNSTVDSFTYKKWTAMLTVTAINAF